MRSIRCVLGIHDWTFVGSLDRVEFEMGYGIHECERCGAAEQNYGTNLLRI
ncbi:hypothetical protein [Halobaculum marinum]|uniref:Uncharacterized protein n=1 Tax=Halobaculum marinum TaxID=3031996 RepID=A0ABD5WUV6_9EURY|nr:hypothetical protein [Halobaculum sp. DT55]